MANQKHNHKARLTIEVEPELQRSVEEAAAAKGQTVRQYVVDALQRALLAEAADQTGEAARWAQLSARSFARDWESPEDAVYDGLS